MGCYTSTSSYLKQETVTDTKKNLLLCVKFVFFYRAVSMVSSF